MEWIDKLSYNADSYNGRQSTEQVINESIAIYIWSPGRIRNFQANVDEEVIL